MIYVCHIITQLELGGAQQNTLYTVKHLNRGKFLPLLLTGSEGILVKEIRRHTDIPQYNIPALIRKIHPWKDFRAFYTLWQILKREKDIHADHPIIVHTHSSKAGILGRWAAKCAGISLIIHSIHGFGFHQYQPCLQRWLFIMLERITARLTTHFIAVARANIDIGIRAGIFSESQVSLIRSGIDIERFRSASGQSVSSRQQFREKMCQELDIPDHKHIIGMVACFKLQKAPLDFVRAIKLVSRHFPEVHAIMVGDGELRPQIEQRIAHEGLEQTISLLGWRTDVPQLLHLCKMLVLTSLWEGLPRVCPQAMAVGLPIVATAVDGTPEAVHDGVNGFLVAPGDIQGLAEKILYLLNNPDIANRIGLQGQHLVDEFDIRRMVRQQEELYQRLVEERT